MKKSIFLFFAAILCAMSVSAKVIYFKPNGNWAAANANFYAHVWGGDGATSPIQFTPVATDPDVYEAEVGTHTSIIFLRMNPANDVTSANMWTHSDNGGPMWNRMGNLFIPTDGKNCCTINDGEWSQETNDASSYVTWSTYTPPTETVIPDRYITGTLAGGWNANDVKMTYDEATETYSHTFTAVAADELHQFKVTDGTWSKNWGGDAVSPAIEGVTTGSDGNVAFTLSVGGDVTITFKDSKIQLTTTGSFTPVETFDYYVVGSFNGWNTADAAYGMTKEGDVYKKEVTFAAAVEFKVCDGTWGAEWGAGNFGDNKYKELDGTNNIVMKEEKTFTIIFNPSDNLITFEGLTPEAVVKYDYYIAGTENLTGYNWSANGLGMEKDGDVYKHTFSELPAGEYQFKITDGQWNTGEDQTHEWNYYNLGAAYEEVSEGTDGDGNPNGNIKIVTEEAKNITVIFDATAGKITFEGFTENTASLTYTVKVPWGTTDCYIAGAATNWQFKQMESAGNRQFSIEIVGAKETDEYKYACQPNWDYAEVIEGGGNRTAWQESDEVTEWNKPIYTVVGSNTNAFGTEWDLENYDNNMNLQDDGTYVWSKPAVSLSAGTEIELKVVKNKKWENAWPSDNYVLNITETAYYQLIVYYNPANNDVTVIKNKLDSETGTLTINGVMLEEMEGEILAISGASSDWTSEVYMFLNDYTGEDNKAYEVNTESSVTYNEGYSMYPNGVSGQLTQSTGADGLRTFTGILDVICEVYDEASGLMVGKPYKLTTTLVEKSDEATIVVVENATLELTGDFLFMEGTWTDGVGTTYPVTAELPGFDPSVASAEYATTVTIGGWGDDDPWLGFVEGTVTVTVEEGVVTLTGVLTNAWTGLKLDVTISGTLPVIPAITLTTGDNSDVIAENVGNVVNVTLDRSFTANQYYTLCVPFDMPASTIGTAYKLGAIAQNVADKGIDINLTTVSTIEAGIPYLVKPNKNVSELVVENVEIENTTGSSYTVSGADVNITLTGIINGGGTTNGTTEYYVGDNGYLYHGTVNKLGLCALFTITNTEGEPVQIRMRVVAGEDEVTGLDQIVVPEGITMKTIVNGQLIIIRDGVKYNVQGQRL